MEGFLTDYVWPGLIMLGQSLLLLVTLLIFIAYILYADRKVWAAVQMRRGPNVVGPWGILQTFADALKFVVKEIVVPAGFGAATTTLSSVATSEAVGSNAVENEGDESVVDGFVETSAEIPATTTNTDAQETSTSVVDRMATDTTAATTTTTTATTTTTVITAILQ